MLVPLGNLVLAHASPFTVISKVYNQNLKVKEDVRTETHTRQCLEHVAQCSAVF